MDPRYNIPLTDPRLGAELLKNDPSGSLAINVWCRHCQEYAGANYDSLAENWIFADRSWPKPIDPQEAVDLAKPLAFETIEHLKSGSNEKALTSAKRVSEILFVGSSDWRRGRGQPASMRLLAVRAYTIRRFNRRPKRPGEPTVGFDRLADLLFLKDGKCPRKIRDKGVTRICGLTQHHYKSPCVKALTAEVTRLKAAMKHAGIRE